MKRRDKIIYCILKPLFRRVDYLYDLVEKEELLYFTLQTIKRENIFKESSGITSVIKKYIRYYYIMCFNNLYKCLQ